MSVTFVIVNVFGMGGTIRTVVTLANHLARAGHRVEIISVVRPRETTFFAIDDRVEVRVLVDFLALARPGGGWRRGLIRWASRRRSRLTPPGDTAYEKFSLWSDIKLLNAVRGLRSDVLVTTRPALSIFAARFAPRRTVTVGQEHVFVHAQQPAVQRSMRRLYPRLDAVVTLTPAHQEDMDSLLAGATTHRQVIPNSIDALHRPVSSQENPLIVVAGRLSHEKQYNQLIRAFALVVRSHPDWKLRIFGSGREKAELQELIFQLELYNHVLLMGRSNTVDREYAKASLTAMSSRWEGLPMTLIEAMAAGVPAVSYDCPHGPRAVITSGHDGLLVAPNDVEALAQSIIDLIEDSSRRLSMAAAAKGTSMRFDSATIGAEWVALFEQLRRQRDGRPAERPLGRSSTAQRDSA